MQTKLFRIGVNGVSGSQIASAISNALLPLIALHTSHTKIQVAQISLSLFMYSILVGVFRSTTVDPYIARFPNNGHLNRFVNPTLVFISFLYVVSGVIFFSTISSNVLVIFVFYIPIFLFYETTKYALIFANSYSLVFKGESIVTAIFLFIVTASNLNEILNAEVVFLAWCTSYIGGIVYHLKLASNLGLKSNKQQIDQKGIRYSFLDWLTLAGGQLLFSVFVLTQVENTEGIAYRLALSCTGFVPIIAYAHFIYITRHFDLESFSRLRHFFRSVTFPICTSFAGCLLLIMLPQAIYDQILGIKIVNIKFLIILTALVHISNMLSLTFRVWHQRFRFLTINSLLNSFSYGILITFCLSQIDTWGVFALLISQLTASLFLIVGGCISFMFKKKRFLQAEL
jgi:hypothetical protein